jgi:hypothetical protein
MLCLAAFQLRSAVGQISTAAPQPPADAGNMTGIGLRMVHIRSMPATVSISEAKQRLGEIADRELPAEQIIIIVRKSTLLVLEQLELPEPAPRRPTVISTTATTKLPRRNPTSSPPAQGFF